MEVEFKPEPINDYEKNMLEGTVNPEQLLEIEKTEEQYIVEKRREYITKVKVIALNKLGKHPLINPSTFRQKEKKQLIKAMEEVMTLTEEEITKQFNEVCADEIFCEGVNYSTYAIYK